MNGKEEMTHKDRIEIEIEMSQQSIRVECRRIGLNLRELDRLNKRETHEFSKLQRKGE